MVFEHYSLVIAPVKKHHPMDNKEGEDRSCGNGKRNGGLRDKRLDNNAWGTYSDSSEMSLKLLSPSRLAYLMHSLFVLLTTCKIQHPTTNTYLQQNTQVRPSPHIFAPVIKICLAWGRNVILA